MLSKLLNTYKFLSISILNCLVLILFLEAFLNLVVDPIYHWETVEDNSSMLNNKIRASGSESLEEYKALIENTRSIGITYHPWLGHLVKDISSEYVNVKKGERLTINKNKLRTKLGEGENDILFLGGSTTFGYGVKDEHTIPSSFSKVTNIQNSKVFNLANPYYHSNQELRVLNNLLLKGKKPDFVIFIDGINEILLSPTVMKDESVISPLIKSRTDFGISHSLIQILYGTGIGKALMKLGVVKQEKLNPIFLGFDDSSRDSSNVGKALLLNYKNFVSEANELCDLNEIICVFIWQPIPFYAYNNIEDKISKQEKRAVSDFVYSRIESEMVGISNFYNLSDFFLNSKGLKYADGYHYSSEASYELALKISEIIDSKRN